MAELTRSLLDGLPKNGPTDPIEYYRRPLVGRVFRERINRGLRLLPGRTFERALEVGYGAGAVLLALSDSVRELHGIDLDADPVPVEALLAARGKSAKLVQGSVYELPYESSSFELAACFSVFEHLDRYEQGLREVARILKPGGLFLLGMPAVNKLMEFGFQAIGFKGIEDHHITTPQTVASSFRRAGLAIQRQHHLDLPLRRPLGLRLYYNWLLRKEGLPHMTKRALLTGATGQDGSYLSELLLEKGYEVHGIIRRASTFNTDRIDHLYKDPHDPTSKLFLWYGDLADSTGLRRLLEKVRPDEVYNLGAQSHVKVSFDEPEYTADVTGLGCLRLLEATRDYQDRTGHQVRFYQASSSEMFGAAAPPQSLATPFHPRSPYACAKVYAFWQTVNYRESYDLFACNGILFNHESERRGETFVTRKITRAVGRIKLGLQSKLYLGNLEAKRDWGHARDYVEAMWLMLQQEKPKDYVVATGEAYSVREFAERAFALVDLDYKEFVEIDPRYFRPAEVDFLQGDPRETFEHLGWRPRTSFEQLVREMVDHDLELARQERTLRDAGHRVALRGIGNT